MLRNGVIFSLINFQGFPFPLHLVLASQLPQVKQAADFFVSLRVVIKVAKK